MGSSMKLAEKILAMFDESSDKQKEESILLYLQNNLNKNQVKLLDDVFVNGSKANNSSDFSKANTMFKKMYDALKAYVGPIGMKHLKSAIDKY